MREYYEHNINMPIYKDGIKLVRGDVYINDDGFITVMRNGEVVYPIKEKKQLDGKSKETVIEDTKELNNNVVKPNLNIINKMNKLQLERFALENFGIDIDRRKNINTLRVKVKKLITGE